MAIQHCPRRIDPACTHNQHENFDNWSANEYSLGKRPITETESDH